MEESLLQDTVADSPNTTEYIALYDSVKITMGLRNLLIQIQEELDGKCAVYEDNDGTRRLAMNGMVQKVRMLYVYS